jgi:hypothetical protein
MVTAQFDDVVGSQQVPKMEFASPEGSILPLGSIMPLPNETNQYQTQRTQTTHVLEVSQQEQDGAQNGPQNRQNGSAHFGRNRFQIINPRTGQEVKALKARRLRIINPKTGQEVLPLDEALVGAPLTPTPPTPRRLP